MRKILALAGTLALIVGLATPAATDTKYVAVQKTLSPFSSSSTSLTQAQRDEVQRVVQENPDAEKFICTGIRYFSQPMSENIKVRARAKAACEFAKELNPNLSTWFQNKPTQARSYAGKVLLTLKVPERSGSSAGSNNPDQGANQDQNVNRAGFANDDPSVWLNSFAKKAGHQCRVEGERVILSGTNKGLECRRESMSTFRWVEVPYLKPYSTRANPTNPKAGSVCYRQGDQVKNDAGLLECRYSAGMKLQFVQLSGSNDAPATSTGLTNVDICKVQDRRANPLGGGAVGFPMQFNRIQTSGVVDVAIIPIDYPDAQAPGSPSDWLKIHLDMLDQRNRDLFGNRIQYRWHLPAEWLRMPLDSINYNQDHATVQPDGSRRMDGTTTVRDRDVQLTEIFSAAESVMNLDQMDFFWVFSNPYARNVPWPPGYYQDVTTKTKTYRNVSAYGIGFWTFNALTVQPAGPKFDGFAHEMQHAHGMIQHAPGNGWAWHQGNVTTWEAWLAGWRPDSQYACVDATSPADAEVNLSAIDLDSSGLKSLVVKVSNTEVLVVESRRKGLYTPAIPKGFAGITVYNVDVTKSGERWDGNLEKEKDYYAYFLRNNRGSYPQTLFGPTLGDENVIAYEGDSFTYRGITITLTQSGDYDTVTVKSASGATPLSEDDEQKFVITQIFGREPEGTPSFCGCCGCFPGNRLH